jgi:hypothetical protein
MYTRYGNVQGADGAVDDKLVIMGSGDELRLRFPARRCRLAEGGSGTSLYVDGWAKTATPTRRIRSRWSRCRSMGCRSILILAGNLPGE